MAGKKQWYTSWTNIVSIVVTVGGCVVSLLSGLQDQQVLTGKWVGVSVMVLGTVMSGLRGITKQELQSGQWVTPAINTLMTAVTAIAMGSTGQ